MEKLKNLAKAYPSTKLREAMFKSIFGIPKPTQTEKLGMASEKKTFMYWKVILLSYAFYGTTNLSHC